MNKLVSAISLILFLHTPIVGAENPAQAYLERLTIGIPSITPAELKDLLDTRPDEIVLLDVRTFHERSQTKTILGSEEIHIPRGFIEVKSWEILPKDKTIVVYCSMGVRSKLAVRTLREMGWKQLQSLDGGVKAWYESQDEDCGCLSGDREIPHSKPESNGECTP